MDWKEERASRYVGLEVIFGILGLTLAVEMPKPRVIDQDDAIVKITGSTICGSDLHLYHGVYQFLMYETSYTDRTRCDPSNAERRRPGP